MSGLFCINWLSSARARVASFCARQWPAYALLFAIGFVVHVPALSGQFLWDDSYLARESPFIKSPLLTLEAFRHHLFPGSSSGHYRPVQNLSYMLDYYFWNTEAAGFHLTNILLHVAGGLLLYRLLTLLLRKHAGLWPADSRELFAPRLAAFFVAAIWIIHPVHSAAVDYISGRADSLAFVFAASGWLLFLHARECAVSWRRFTFFALAGLSALAALCSREIACIWLLIFLLHTLFFAGAVQRKQKIACVMAGVVILVVYGWLRQLPVSDGSEAHSEGWPASLRLALMLRALGDYGRLLVWPGNLHMDRSVVDPSAFTNRSSWREAAGLEYLSVLGMLIAAAFACGCVWPARGRRVRILGTVWFFAAYLPISNIVQLNATVAEHWLYLPSVGALIFLLGCALEIPQSAYRVLAPVSLVALISLGVRSTIRSSDWSDDETFFSHTLAAGGASGRVMVNLALCYADRGLYAKSEAICRRILQVDPHYLVAQNNLGFTLSREGKTAEAEAVFAQSATEAPVYSRTYPRSWVAVVNYAHLRHSARDDASAIAALEAARRNYPDTWEVIALESELLRKTKGPSAALELVHRFAERHWWHHAARLGEGRLYAENNDVTRAQEALRWAAALDVHDAEALNLLARIYAGRNELERARETMERAVARQPDKPSEYFLLTDILEKMGRTKEQRTVLAKVSALQALANSQRPRPAIAN